MHEWQWHDMGITSRTLQPYGVTEGMLAHHNHVLYTRSNLKIQSFPKLTHSAPGYIIVVKRLHS